MTAGVQLPLELSKFEHSSFDNYFAGPNSEVVDSLGAAAKGLGPRVLVLWGSQATGKTHLLQATCAAVTAGGGQAAYLPLDVLVAEHHPGVLEGLEMFDLVCLDDVDAAGGNEVWQVAIFNLYNRLFEAERRFIASAAAAPAKLPITLEDLVSRLSAGLALRLTPLSDADKSIVLKRRAGDLGLELADEVAAFLLKHRRRDLASLMQLLDELDHASLAAQRKLTIPFVRSYLQQRQ